MVIPHCGHCCLTFILCCCTLLYVAQGVGMATQFHSGLSLVSQTRTSFPPSLPATSLLLGRAKPSANSCFSTHIFKHCSSPLRVLCAAGSKESAAQSVEIPAIEYHKEELPPLLASMTIAGLPPCQESMFVDEALATILQSGLSDLFGAYYHLCNSYTSFSHCGAVSCDRLATMSTNVTLLTIVDDILLDKQDGLLLEKLGIDPNILGSPELIREYLHSLEVLVCQENPPQSPDRIQEVFWKLGCDFRKLSNPEWLDLFSGALHDFFNANYEGYCARLVGDRTNIITDLEALTQMRTQGTGGRLASLSVEFCNEVFLPIEVREHSAVQQLTRASWRYTAYVNDIFSFSKESIHEPHNSYNLIKMLMESEGLSLPQAARRALNLTNSIAHDFMELEAQLPEEPWTSLVRRYAEGLKEFMAGALYWYSMNQRYRDPKAPFPELRDVNVPFNTKADTVKTIRQ
jgi:hypothetical protein